MGLKWEESCRTRKINFKKEFQIRPKIMDQCAHVEALESNKPKIKVNVSENDLHRFLDKSTRLKTVATSSSAEWKIVTLSL